MTAQEPIQTQTRREANEVRRVEVATPRLLLTPEEAADVLGVGRTKLYELMGEGLIESVRIGGCRRVPVAAVDCFVEWLRGGDTQGEASDRAPVPPPAAPVFRTPPGSPGKGRDGSYTTDRD